MGVSFQCWCLSLFVACFLFESYCFTRWWVDVVVLRVKPIWEDYLIHFFENKWVVQPPPNYMIWPSSDCSDCRKSKLEAVFWIFGSKSFFDPKNHWTLPKEGFGCVFCRGLGSPNHQWLEIALFLGKHVLSHFKPMKKNLDSFFFVYLVFFFKDPIKSPYGEYVYLFHVKKNEGGFFGSWRTCWGWSVMGFSSHSQHVFLRNQKSGGIWSRCIWVEMPKGYHRCEGNVITESLHLSNEKNPGWLGYVGDYTTQLYRDYNKPL